MKTMNYLFTVVFALVLGACTNESQPLEEELSTSDFKSRVAQENEETKEGPIYLEGDLHLMALEHELFKLELEIVRIEEEIENGENDDSGSLQTELERFQDEKEKAQRWIDSGKEDYWRNGDAIEEILSQSQDSRLADFFRSRPRRPPGRGGNPCGGKDIERCPLVLENATIYIAGREDIDIKTTRNGRPCGGLVDLVDVPGSEARIQEGVLESEEGCADEITFSGVNSEGNKFSYSFQVVR